VAVADVIKREGQGVMVEVKNKKQLQQFPKALKSDLHKLYKNPYPYVVFADPALTKSYGSFHHNQLKSKDFRSLFRDTKKQIREAIKAKSFLAAEPPVDEKYEVQDAVESKPTVITDKTIYDWKSAQGSIIRARLVSIEGDNFVFETEGGKSIEASADQLTSESVEKARGLAAE